jgi:hypothetical protein
LDKLKLPDVTLIAVSSIKIPQTIWALEKSCEGVEFGDVKLITHEKFEHPLIKFEECDKIDSIDKYNEFMFLRAGYFIDTEFALVQQYDSFIIRPQKWTNEFLSVDYCAAPWPIVPNAYIANDGIRSRVGNGGFSLRSRKLMRLPLKYGWYLRSEQNQKSEDGQICCYWKKEMLEQNIKYSSVNLASQFSFENEVEENRGIDSFGFHKHWRAEWVKELMN